MDHLTRRLLNTATKAFDAQSGAVYLHDNGKPQLKQQRGQWQGDAKLSVPWQVNGKTIGQIALGTRRNGAKYEDADRALLQEIANVVALALEPDQK